MRPFLCTFVSCKKNAPGNLELIILYRLSFLLDVPLQFVPISTRLFALFTFLLKDRGVLK